MVLFLYEECDVNYSKDEFFALMGAIEAAGGEHLDETCSPKTYNFSGPNSKPLVIAGCGNSSRFEIPYERAVQGARRRQTVNVCAVDDNVGMWPRFGGDRFHNVKPNPEDVF